MEGHTCIIDPDNNATAKKVSYVLIDSDLQVSTGPKAQAHKG